MASWIKFGAVLVALALGVSVLVAWRDARQQQEALQTELKNTQQALADATARQASRDQALNSLLTQLKKNKAAVQTPEQAIAALPKVLPLPQPITLGPSGANTTEAGADASQAKPNAKATPSQADASHATKAPASEGGRYRGFKSAAGKSAVTGAPL